MKQVHELAKLLPPIPADEFAKLVADIRENGLHHPIVLCEGKVLDGVHRDKACDKAGVRPKYEAFTGKDPLTYVISENVLRRHLTPSQRAMLALELEERFAAEPKQKGRPNGSKNNVEPKLDTKSRGHTRARDARSSAGRAAAVVGVNVALVNDAKRLAGKSKPKASSKPFKTASPEVLDAVRSGKVTIGEALTDLRNARADERIIRERYQEKMKRLQKDNRQVADFLAACKSFSIAIEVARESLERFSPEARQFTKRKVEELIENLGQFKKEVSHAQAA
ncbi:MAG: hypothetical protein C5B60_00150 [Chloroflexi bacterium]|nr:MAG: hypothetical protein C5B60_00150 [Chloroflexota bacterium]